MGNRIIFIGNSDNYRRPWEHQWGSQWGNPYGSIWGTSCGRGHHHRHHGHHGYQRKDNSFKNILLGGGIGFLLGLLFGGFKKNNQPQPQSQNSLIPPYAFKGEKYYNSNNPIGKEANKECFKNHQAQIRDMDINADGKVDYSEGGELAPWMDINKDGKIDTWENMSLSLYQDINKDGIITQKEYGIFYNNFKNNPNSITQGIKYNFENTMVSGMKEKFYKDDDYKNYLLY